MIDGAKFHVKDKCKVGGGGVGGEVPVLGRGPQTHRGDASGMNRSLWVEEIEKYRKEASVC